MYTGLALLFGDYHEKQGGKHGYELREKKAIYRDCL